LVCAEVAGGGRKGARWVRALWGLRRRGRSPSPAPDTALERRVKEEPEDLEAEPRPAGGWDTCDGRRTPGRPYPPPDASAPAAAAPNAPPESVAAAAPAPLPLGLRPWSAFACPSACRSVRLPDPEVLAMRIRDLVDFRECW